MGSSKHRLLGWISCEGSGVWEYVGDSWHGRGEFVLWGFLPLDHHEGRKGVDGNLLAYRANDSHCAV